jgi:hypothetical protein
VIATSVISKSATKEDDQQNNYEDQFHDKALLSIVSVQIGVTAPAAPPRRATAPTSYAAGSPTTRRLRNPRL